MTLLKPNQKVQHVNVYGPPCTGKTRHAEQLARHYKCDAIIEAEDRVRLELRPQIRTLILSYEPIVVKYIEVKHVRITDALKAIGEQP